MAKKSVTQMIALFVRGWTKFAIDIHLAQQSRTSFDLTWTFLLRIVIETESTDALQVHVRRLICFEI